jgi:hypothetical protein
VLELHDARWQFRHSKIREAVLAQLAAEELPALHCSVAQALAAVHRVPTGGSAERPERWIASNSIMNLAVMLDRERRGEGEARSAETPLPLRPGRTDYEYAEA